MYFLICITGFRFKKEIGKIGGYALIDQVDAQALRLRKQSDEMR
jgi:hypothetical protein